MIYLGTGHGYSADGRTYDPGAIYLALLEEYRIARTLTMWAQEQLWRAGVAHVPVPPGTLREKLRWLRGRMMVDDLAVEVHLNSVGDSSPAGVEVFFHGYPLAQAMADSLARTLAEGSGMQNRGGKHESLSPRKRLGWCHPPAGVGLLVEAGFLSNPGDRAILLGTLTGFKTGRAIAAGIIEARTIQESWWTRHGPVGDPSSTPSVPVEPGS